MNPVEQTARTEAAPQATDPAWTGSGVVGVLSDPHDAETRRARSTDHFGDYALEILAHAGVPHVTFTRADIAGDPGRLPGLLLLPYQVRLTPAEANQLQAHVDAGGAVVATGGVEGANALFGITATRQNLAAGILHWPEGGLGLEAKDLPVWGAQLSQPEDDGTAHTLGKVTDSGDPSRTGIAAAMATPGRGIAVYLAIDIPGSVVRLQQGWPVLGDGRPAPDGSAALNDRLLKTDDGIALEWSYRESVADQLAFITPYADRLRELLLAALFTCAEHLGAPLPLVWYWPDGAPSAGTLSFDTDSNEGGDGWRFLEVLAALELEGTWCVMFPGGYPRELYDALRQKGQEIALHYDGLTTDLNGAPHCDWSEADLKHQYDWLKRETGVEKVISQKNHVTRWEGWVEFFRWLERVGIQVDQTKGPSKIGNLGFAFGSCHIWRPIEDAGHDNRLMDLLEIPFLTHDMWQSEQRLRLRRALVDAVIQHNGIAHFIFHPQRIWEQGMPEAIADIVDYAREQGLAWWTSEQIAAWETARRATRVRCRLGGDGLQVELGDAPQGLTLLVAGLTGRPKPQEGVKVTEVEFLGRRVLQLTFDENPPARVRLELAEV